MERRAGPLTEAPTRIPPRDDFHLVDYDLSARGPLNGLADPSPAPCANHAKTAARMASPRGRYMKDYLAAVRRLPPSKQDAVLEGLDALVARIEQAGNLEWLPVSVNL